MQEKIILSDFCNISSRVAIYSSNDDYSGEYMTNPMVPSVLTNISSDDVNIGKHVIIGSNSIILPGVHLGEGVAIGALSLVTKSIESYKVAAGTPAKVIKDRATNIRVLEESLQRQ